MLIPIGADVRKTRGTTVTYALIALCVLVFIYQLAVRNPAEPPGTNYRSLILFSGPGGAWQWWQFITYQFLHADWMHLLGNMLFLWIFGPAVEDRFGRLGFLGLYLGTGVLAGIAHGTIAGQPVIGASGSIAGITGAFLVMFPQAPIRVLLFFFVIGTFVLPGWIFVAIRIAYDLFGLGAGARGVAYVAHLGGYASGAGIALLALAARWVPREPYNLVSMTRQAARRRAYKEVVHKADSSPWIAESSVQQPSRRRRQKERTAEPAVDASAEHRKRIIDLLAQDKKREASDVYLEMIARHANAALPRDAQLQVSNELHARGKHADAFEAYQTFIKRHPSDRETPQAKLLLAVISARYLNDPVHAQHMLDELAGEELSDELDALASNLREELG
jgi:membrane associated rhomboid family serine protease